MNISIESGQFIAQISRPSFAETISQYKTRIWEKRNDDLEITHRRLYVMFIVIGKHGRKFLDNLGYIDLLTGDVVVSNPRMFKGKMQAFIDLVEDAYNELLANHPDLNTEGDENSQPISDKIVSSIPKFKAIGANYGNRFRVEVWNMNGYYNLYLFADGQFHSEIGAWNRNIHQVMARFQPDPDAWIDVDKDFEDAKKS